MIDKILNDFSIVRGELRNAETGYIVFVHDDLARQKVEHSFFLVFHKGDWLWPTANADKVDWTTTSLTVVKEPKEQALFLGLWGQIQRVGSGDVKEETALADLPDGPKKFGPLSCIRAIDGRAYAAGIDRQVYVRKDMDLWERIDAGVLVESKQKHTLGFECIHGLNANSIYAAGLHGEIWHYDGTRWMQEESPTKKIIADIWCSDTGKVYACGLDGLVLVRDGGAWRLIEHEATYDHFWAVREFGGRIFLATMKYLYELCDDSTTPVDFGPDAPETCFSLSAANGVLWSVGAKNIFSFDGTSWTRIA